MKSSTIHSIETTNLTMGKHNKTIVCRSSIIKKRNDNKRTKRSAHKSNRKKMENYKNIELRGQIQTHKSQTRSQLIKHAPLIYI